MNRDLALAAMAMGYRQFNPDQPGIWAKPLGYTLLVIDGNKEEIKQLFVAANSGETLVWDRLNLESRHGYLFKIKEFEAFHTHSGLGENPGVHKDKTFHFLSLPEQLTLDV